MNYVRPLNLSPCTTGDLSIPFQDAEGVSLTLTITPTQGLTDTMSTFRLFLLEMVRQGGCHAVTLFLFELHLLFEKVRAAHFIFFSFPRRPEVLKEVRKVRILWFSCTVDTEEGEGDGRERRAGFLPSVF
jgi:hypothetical protein